jgi:hypothetical protein
MRAAIGGGAFFVVIARQADVAVAAVLARAAARGIRARVRARRSTFTRLGHTMLARSAVCIGSTGDTTVILRPTAAFARARTVTVNIAFDADQPFRRADLRPRGAPRGAFVKRTAVGDARIAFYSTSPNVCNVEREVGVAANGEQQDTQGRRSELIHGELTRASASARAKPLG